MSDRERENRDAPPPADRQQAGKLVDQDAPRKEHGDALRSGTGSRQGSRAPARGPAADR